MAASPVPDKVFRVDLDTAKYIGYKEFTPRSVSLNPEQFMERRFYDVLPANIAEQVDRSLSGHDHAIDFDCSVFGHWVSTHAIVHQQLGFLNCTIRRRIG